MSIFMQPYVVYGVILLAAACLVFGVASFFEPVRAAVTASARRATPMQWVVTGISNKLVPEDERERGALKKWLNQAGFDAPNAVQIYYGIRVTAAVGSAATMFFLSPIFHPMEHRMLLMLTMLAGMVGFFAPLYVVRVRHNTRQRKFREGLPDALDLLLICSESGLGIDMSILKVAEEMEEPHPLLAEQFFMVNSELRAGLSRSDAMRGFADRTGIEETISLVNLLVQSDALGTSMAQTLRVFSNDMRAHRMLRAEEQGHKVGAKLTVILVAMFLPGIFAAVLAPAIHQALKGMASLSEAGVPWGH